MRRGLSSEHDDEESGDESEDEAHECDANGEGDIFGAAGFRRHDRIDFRFDLRGGEHATVILASRSCTDARLILTF